MPESPAGQQVDAKLRADVALLCGLIMSAEDPAAPGEAEAAEVRKRLLGRLAALSAQVARIERELRELQGVAAGVRPSGRGEPEGAGGAGGGGGAA